MADFSKLSINGTSYNVKDASGAQQTANSAQSTANSAQQTATEANNTANSVLAQLEDISAEYVNATYKGGMIMSDVSKIQMNGEILNIKDSTARASIATLNASVNTLNASVNTLINKNIIIIGDSYGVDSSAGGKSWASYVEDIYTNCIRLTVGGTGFGSDVYTDTNWLEMLENASVTNKAIIKDIYVFGGANDANLLYDGRLTTTVLANRINSFCQYCATNYPNAIVHIGFIGWYLSMQKFNAYINAKNVYRECALNNANASYVSGVEYIMHNTGFINTTDLIHPIESASKLLGTVICNVINSKSDCVSVSFSTVPDLTSDYACSGYNLTCVYVGSVAIINMTGSSDATYSYMTARINAGVEFKFGSRVDMFSLSNIPKGGSVPPSTHINVYIGGDGTDIRSVPCLLQLQDNYIMLTNVSTENMPVAKAFLIPNFQIVIPLETN